MLRKKLQALFNPERFHGWGKSKSYFEGWYYKIISADEKHAYAFIPGIAYNAEGDSQAFVQVLDGKKLSADYHKFPIEEFSSESERFIAKISSNTFEVDKLSLDLEDVKGVLNFEELTPWPSSFLSPGIMGPYSFVPFMECYHGILSMDHTIEGKLTIKGEEIDFNGGRGYMEKDWGRSFPSAYFWMQSNHFSTPGISLKASVAKIPWLGSSFVGFIAGLYFNGELIQFTTYNSTKLVKSFANNEMVLLTMENKKYILDINAKRDHATELASPILGFMDGRISESMTSSIELTLVEKKTNSVLFKDTGRNAGLEVAGKIEEIIQF